MIVLGHLNGEEWKSVSEGVKMKILVHGEDLMMTAVRFKKGSLGKIHKHHNEQISYALKGKFLYKLGDSEFILEEGMSILIPSNVLHGVEALEDGVLLDVFTPIRRDLL